MEQVDKYFGAADEGHVDERVVLAINGSRRVVYQKNIVDIDAAEFLLQVKYHNPEDAIVDVRNVEHLAVLILVDLLGLNKNAFNDELMRSVSGVFHTIQVIERIPLI